MESALVIIRINEVFKISNADSFRSDYFLDLQFRKVCSEAM